MEENYAGQKNGAIEGGRPGLLKQDPWANRNDGMKCSSCIWFVPKFISAPVVRQDHKVVGRCRRHAPSMSGYPVVYQDDWCGDHRVDENKV